MLIWCYFMPYKTFQMGLKWQCTADKPSSVHNFSSVQYLSFGRETNTMSGKLSDMHTSSFDIKIIINLLHEILIDVHSKTKYILMIRLLIWSILFANTLKLLAIVKDEKVKIEWNCILINYLVNDDFLLLWLWTFYPRWKLKKNSQAHVGANVSFSMWA